MDAINLCGCLAGCLVVGELLTVASGNIWDRSSVPRNWIGQVLRAAVPSVDSFFDVGCSYALLAIRMSGQRTVAKVAGGALLEAGKGQGVT